MITTSYGRAALDALRTVVADAKVKDAMAAVTILVPNNTAGIVARRYLALGLLGDGRPGVAGLHLSTLPRLAEQLAAPSLAPRTPATRPIVAAAWRRALSNDPGAFRSIATHPATVRGLAQAHRELRELSAAARSGVRNTTTITPSLIRLHEHAAATISRRHYDSVDLLGMAADLVASHAFTQERITELGTLIMYLPQDLAPPEARFTQRLADRAEINVIAGITGVRRADSAVSTTLARLGLSTPTAPPIPTASNIINASDSDDEVRCVVRDLMQTLKTTPAHRTAVLYAATSPYARLLHEHLSAAGVAVNGAGTRAVNERAIARTLLEVLALADGDVPRADLFRAVANAPTRDFTGERIPISRWERTSRSAGIVRGDDWGTRLDALINTEHTTIEVEQTSDDPRDWLIERSKRTIDTASALQRFATSLRQELHRAEGMTTWRELADWCLDLFSTLVGELNDLRHLPAEEQYAAATITTLLTGLQGLDEVDSDASLSALRELLDLELTATLPRVGRFGEGVLVAPVSAAIGLDVDVVYVVGLSEDIYPGRIHEDALLPERARAATDGELSSYRERLHARQRHLLAAFSAATARTVASFPRGDLRRSSRRLPSRWLLPSLRALSGDKELAASDWDKADYQGHMSTSGSYAGELLTTSRLAYEQEWRVRSAQAAGTLDDQVVRAGITLIRARTSAEFTRYDGNLSRVDGLPDYSDGVRVVSPTALEAYVECPHAFFVQRLLKVQQIEQPEDVVTISPADIGNVIHQSIERLVKECDYRLPGYGEPWSQRQRARLAEIAQDVMREFEDRGLTGHWRLWQREKLRILADLAWLMDDDDKWRSEVKAQVRASELAFGMDGKEPVPVPLPDDRAVLMRGSVDKVDIAEDGIIYVTDVKTGSRRPFKQITQEDPFVGGTKLQLPVYAYAARARLCGPNAAVQTSYWFVRSKGSDTKNRGRIGFLLTPEVEQQYARILELLTRSIRSGLFPLRAPEGPDFAWVQCDYCNPDGIGHAEERERWERKLHDPALREYVALVEPDAIEKPSSEHPAGVASAVTAVAGKAS